MEAKFYLLAYQGSYDVIPMLENFVRKPKQTIKFTMLMTLDYCIKNNRNPMRSSPSPSNDP